MFRGSVDDLCEIERDGYSTVDVREIIKRRHSIIYQCEAGVRQFRWVRRLHILDESTDGYQIWTQIARSPKHITQFSFAAIQSCFSEMTGNPIPENFGLFAAMMPTEYLNALI